MKNIFEKFIVGIFILLMLKVLSLHAMTSIFTPQAIYTIKGIHFIVFYMWVSLSLGCQLFKLFGVD